MVSKALIVLQENSGRIPLPDVIGDSLQQLVFNAVDALAETFEDLKTRLQAAGKYDVVELLTDNACKRARLLNALVAHTKKGRTIDLIVLGHGTSEILNLKGEVLTGGAGGNIRSLLPDARKKGVKSLNLRMVYMCNCYGSTLNDDWLRIGAKASVGSFQNDMMPEPMTTFFVHNWLKGLKVGRAASEAYDATIPFYSLIYPPTVRPRMRDVQVPYPCPTFTNLLKMCQRTIQVPDGVVVTPHDYVRQTRLVVDGDQNLKF